MRRLRNRDSFRSTRRTRPSPAAQNTYAIGIDQKNVIYMAGIYRFEHDRPVFSILTREPAESIRFIHNRMPVILPREAVRDWLNTSYKADEILRSAALNVSHRLA